MAVKSNHVVQQEAPPVLVKGIKTGLLFALDEHCPFDTLVGHLQDLLHGDMSGMFSGPQTAVSVDYGTRELSAEEIRVLMTLFLERDNFFIREWGPRTMARKSLPRSRSQAPGQTIFKGTVRAGQRLIFDGDVVVVGDVNPGGEIVASGDVYVFGRLSGIAHAGSDGDKKAVVAAAEFAPMQLRIASIVSRAPEVNGRTLQGTMEFAYLRDDGMAVDKVKYLASFRQK